MSITYHVDRTQYKKLISCGIAFFLELAFCFLYFQLNKTISFVYLFPVILLASAGLSIKFYNIKMSAIVNCLIALALSVLYVYFARKIIRKNTLSDLGRIRYTLNLLVYLVCVSFFYLIFGKQKPAYLVSFWILEFFEVLNLQIVKLRYNEITPADILSIRTAIAVSKNYTPYLNPEMIELVAVAVFITWFLIYAISFPQKNSRRFIAVAVLVLEVTCFSYGLSKINAEHWRNSGTKCNGFIVNFIKSITELNVKAPENYSLDVIDSLEEKYSGNSEKKDRYPNIIVIMSESFADFRAIGDDILTDREVLPYFDSLKENTIKGYALSSVYGGNTPNSEWEFLTGNSIGFLPASSIPYQTYIRKENNQSLLNNLKSLNYKCIAMHPYFATGWKRNEVYPKFGFDEFYSINDFPQKKFVRNYLSDQEFYQELIRRFESKEKGEHLFLFGISMQNHGPYTFSQDSFPHTINIRSPYQANTDAEQYLNLSAITDANMELLISYFQNVPEDTVILFFGDHQPSIEQDYLDAVHGKAFETLDEKQKLYTIPFFIWANYDIEEEEIECTSINYLSNYLFRVSGLPTTGFNRFLMDVESEIPALNALGYYSREKGTFIPLDEASGSEAEALSNYRILQYNSMFDHKNPSSIFLP